MLLAKITGDESKYLPNGLLGKCLNLVTNLKQVTITAEGMPKHRFVRESSETQPPSNRFLLWLFQNKKRVEWKHQNLKGLEIMISTGTCQFSLSSHPRFSPISSREIDSGSMAGQAPDAGSAPHC